MSKNIRKTRASLLADTRGLSTVEYVILLCLIGVVGLAVWVRFGRTVQRRTQASASLVNGIPTGQMP